MRKIIAVMLLVLLHSSMFSQPTWKRIEDMSIARYGHEAIYIGNNRILIMGGFRVTDRNSTNICEIIDTKTNRVRTVQSMESNRAQFAAVLLPDSNVVVFGGATNSNGGSAATVVELFNSRTESWTSIGNLNSGRQQHAAIMIDSTRILVVGGWLNSSTEIYDLKTNRSKSVGSFSFECNGVRLMKTKSGEILAYGGRKGGQDSYREDIVYKFDLKTEQWRGFSFYPEKTYLPYPTKLWNETIISTGGSYSETSGSYRFSSLVAKENGNGGFDSVASTGVPTCWHQAKQWNSDSILVVGGYDYQPFGRVTTTWINLNTFNCTPGPSMNEGRAIFRVVEVPVKFDVNNKPTAVKFYAIGGIASGSPSQSIEFIEPSLEPVVNPCSKPFKEISLADSYFLGSARKSVADKGIILTQPRDFQAGAFWSKEKLDITKSFTSVFQFKVSSGNDNSIPEGSIPGADGIAFVLHNDSLNSILTAAEGIGYSGIKNSIAIEIDLYKNDSRKDGNGNHIAVQSNGTLPNSSEHAAPYLRGLSNSIPTIYNEKEYWCKVQYNVESKVLKVALSENFNQFSNQLTVENFDISNLISSKDGTVWAGFTGSTGSAWAEQEILSWYVAPCGDGDLLSSVPTSSSISSIEVFPNPVQDLLNITGLNSRNKVKIVNMLGETMTELTMNQQTTESLSISTENLPQGNYLIVVYHDNRLDQTRQISVYK